MDIDQNTVPNPGLRQSAGPSKFRRAFSAVWRTATVVIPVCAGALGLSLEPEALVNVAVGAVMKRLPNKTVPNWTIPAVNVLIGAGVAIAQGASLEQAAAKGAERAIIAAGVHTSIKNPVKAMTGRNI